MDTSAFLRSLPEIWDGDPQSADHPRDRRFGTVLEQVRGMATENKLALLNAAAAQLGPGEIYLEVGTWAGCSVIGAALGNTGRFVAVDDFSQFGGPEDECRQNVASFGLDHVEVVNRSVWDYFAAGEVPGPVGVYFYDGGHTYEDQYRALVEAERFLADEALVIVDDTAWAEVSSANADATRYWPQFRLVADFASPYNSEPRWWNGIEVFTFRRADVPTGPRRTAVVLRRRLWDATKGLRAWTRGVERRARGILGPLRLKLRRRLHRL